GWRAEVVEPEEMARRGRRALRKVDSRAGRVPARDARAPPRPVGRIRKDGAPRSWSPKKWRAEVVAPYEKSTAAQAAFPPAMRGQFRNAFQGSFQRARAGSFASLRMTGGRRQGG